MPWQTHNSHGTQYPAEHAQVHACIWHMCVCMYSLLCIIIVCLQLHAIYITTVGSDDGNYYTHLGAGKDSTRLRATMEKRFSVTGKQLRMVEVWQGDVL